MQNFLYDWAISIVTAVIFSAVISSLLPETTIKKYVKVVLGIVVTIMILYPLITAVGGIDVKNEIESSLQNMQRSVDYEFESSSYKDYVQKVYMPE